MSSEYLPPAAPRVFSSRLAVVSDGAVRSAAVCPLDFGRRVLYLTGVQVESSKPPSLVPLVVTLFALIVAFHLGNALLGKPLFLGSHLGTALEYARGPINLLRPVIVGFNATGTPTAPELPLWQAAAGLAFKATGSTWYGWANLVSLLAFATALWPFFQLARHYVGERAAWWGTAFFLTQPLIVLWAGLASTEAFCQVLAIWYLFFADKMIRTGNAWWWLPTTLLAALSAVSKVPFFMAAGLCSVFLLMVNGVRPWRTWGLLAGAGVVAVGLFAAWTHHTGNLAAQAEYPYYELRLSHSPLLVWWCFGDWHFRLSPGPWIKGGWRFLHATLGSLPLIALLVPALLRAGNRLPKLWLLATFLTTLVFTHLVLEHWHYYLMCCPAVALLCGATLARWEPFWAQEMPATWLRLALAGGVLVLSAIEGVISMKVAINYDYYPQKIAALLQQYTKPEDKLIFYDSARWSGEELFRSGRKGLCVYSLEGLKGVNTVKGLYDLLGNQADLRRLKSLGYNKLVLMSESPVQVAVQAVNPGSKRQRFCYPATISPTVDAWPVVYRSEDILIKEIP